MQEFVRMIEDDLAHLVLPPKVRSTDEIVKLLRHLFGPS
jgi:hypothetical protein